MNKAKRNIRSKAKKRAQNVIKSARKKETQAGKAVLQKLRKRGGAGGHGGKYINQYSTTVESEQYKSSLGEEK